MSTATAAAGSTSSPTKRSHKRKTPLPPPLPLPPLEPEPTAPTAGAELDEDGEPPLSAEEEEALRIWDSFAEEYHDIIAELPLEYQRNFILLKDLELVQQEAATTLNSAMQSYLAHLASTPATPPDEASDDSRLSASRRAMLLGISKAAQSALRAGEDKVGLAVTLYEAVDRHIRRLDDDLHKYEDSLVIGLRAGTLPSHDAPSTSKKSPPGATTSRGAIALGEKDAYVQESDEKSKRRGRGGEAEQKRKRKRRKEDGPRPLEPLSAVGEPPAPELAVELSMPIDPSEPTYCYCEQVSYGEMIGCDNDACRREWFHLACTLLDKTPAGKWFCDDCASASESAPPLTPSPRKKKYRKR